jgi:pimeloyl-ACP methyl ester carboxylesterase
VIVFLKGSTYVRKPSIELVMGDLGIPMSKNHGVMEKWGYTGTACIPMAFDDAKEKGLLKMGEVVVFGGSGVGYKQSAAAFRMKGGGNRRPEERMAVKIVLGIVLVALAVLVAVGAWFYRHPLAALARAGRRSLKGARFVRTSWESAVGRQTGFVAGQGPLVVLLHGAGDQAGGWSAVAPKLAAAHRIVVLDLAGHGESAPRTGPIRVQDVVDGLDAVLKAESASGPATLIGNSLGAWVAFLEGAAHPERVARIVAINGGPLKGDNETFTLQPKSREEARKTVAALRDSASPSVPGYVLDDIVRQAQEGPLARLAETAGEMERYVMDGKLSDFHIPVDIVWGESDRMLTLDYARRLQAQVAGSHLVTIPGCGHAPATECPAMLTRILREILEGAGPSPKTPPTPVAGGKP